MKTGKKMNNDLIISKLSLNLNLRKTHEIGFGLLNYWENKYPF